MFATRYNRKKFSGVSFSQPSLTKQSMKDECDVNRILKNYKKTGLLPNVDASHLYGDFVDVPDYQDAMNVVIRANEQFAGLDSKLRDRFSNDPSKFLQFVSDEKNLEEMYHIGLATRPVKPPVVHDPIKPDAKEAK